MEVSESVLGVATSLGLDRVEKASHGVRGLLVRQCLPDACTEKTWELRIVLGLRHGCPVVLYLCPRRRIDT